MNIWHKRPFEANQEIDRCYNNIMQQIWFLTTISYLKTKYICFILHVLANSPRTLCLDYPKLYLVDISVILILYQKQPIFCVRLFFYINCFHAVMYYGVLRDVLGGGVYFLYY